MKLENVVQIFHKNKLQNTVFATKSIVKHYSIYCCQNDRLPSYNFLNLRMLQFYAKM